MAGSIEGDVFGRRQDAISQNLRECPEYRDDTARAIRQHTNSNDDNISYYMTTPPLLPFVGRQRELGLLDEEHGTPGARLIVLYGRRRVGKTHLIQQWMATHKVRSLYWVADPTSATDQLRSFSQAVFTFEHGDTPPSDFTYGDWRVVLQRLARLAEHERIVVAIDEFTYLMEVTSGIAGIFQNAWDQWLRHSQLILILSGSHLGLMTRGALSYGAPLYGRATALLHLPPLPLSALSAFFPSYQIDERVAVYAMLGGIPAYWERLDRSASLSDNIRTAVLGGRALLMDEPRLLLKDFLSEIHNYVGILRAIADGEHAHTAIAKRVGLKDAHLSQFMRNLEATGYVERRTSVTAAPTSKLGRYHITDPFLRFYFRFLSRRQPQLAQGIRDSAVAELRQHLVDFIGTHTWEELCRAWTLQATVHDRLPGPVDQVGSAWTRQVQIDVAAINRDEHVLLLGECKWLHKPAEAEVLTALRDKVAAVLPAEGAWKVHLLGFSRQGWTDEARRLARAWARTPIEGERWSSIGIKLLDLGDVDRDLATWEQPGRSRSAS